jgi:Flp pilus assembly protein TadG
MRLTLKKQESGQAFLEFCLVAPIVILIMMAVLSFGLLFAWTNVINNAAREGGRAASVCTPDDQVTAKVINSCSILPNANNVTVKITETMLDGSTRTDGSRQRGGSIKVEVQYTPGGLFIPGWLNINRTLKAQSTFRMECGT